MTCAANSASDDAPLGSLPARGGGGSSGNPALVRRA
jgi:hypothetical protein